MLADLEMFTLVLTTLVTQTCGVTMTEGRPRYTDEQRLLRKILTDYDHYTRPVFNASHPVIVNVGITLNQIFDVDERNQVLTTQVWLDQEWYDERLTWEPEEFNNLKTLRVPCHLIWKPDIVLYNSADDYTDGYMPALAMVDHDGRVFWPPIVRLRSTCKIDITFFPFDDQTCKLKLGSWAYDGLQVDVRKRKDMDFSNYISNGEWELIALKMKRNVVTYGCCSEPYPDVTFTLHLRRRTLYYTYNVIIPCVMLSALTLLGFWMSPDGGEKVPLGLTVLLSFSVFMLLIAENMPATSFYIPLIGVYIIMAMALTCVSVILAVFISYMHNQCYTSNPVPSWLRRFTTTISRFLFCTKKKNRSFLRRSTTNQSRRSDIRTPLRESFSNGSVYSNQRHESESENSVTVVIDKKGKISTNHVENKPRMRHKLTSPTDDLVSKLDRLLTKHYDLLQQRTEDTNPEWREVAEIIDRLCFWIYTFVVILVTVVILVFLPMTKNVSI